MKWSIALTFTALFVCHFDICRC